MQVVAGLERSRMPYIERLGAGGYLGCKERPKLNGGAIRALPSRSGGSGEGGRWGFSSKSMLFR